MEVIHRGNALYSFFFSRTMNRKMTKTSFAVCRRWCSERIQRHDPWHMSPVLPIYEEETLDFEDPMMVHEQNWRARITEPEENPTMKQRKYHKVRDIHRVRGKISAAEIATAVRENLEDEVEQIKKKIITGHAIPPSVREVTITHIGTLDGFDEEVDHVKLSREKALQYETELNMTLCMTDISECLTTAYCRLRHFETYCIRNARNSIAYRMSQKQSSLPSDIIEMNLRGGIDDINLAEKSREVVKELFNRKRVRINIRLTVHPQDASDILLYACRMVDREAKFMSSPSPIPAVAFKMMMPVFTNHGASCVLVPLAENSRESKFISKAMLDEMSDALQTKQDQEFEEELFGASDTTREKFDEKRRRQFWGAQEDFISAKLRDINRIERHAPWSLPDTEEQITHREIENALRRAGQNQGEIVGANYNTSQGEHEFMSQEDDALQQYGDPNSDDIELSPGPDGGRRWYDVEKKLGNRHEEGYWGQSEAFV